MYMRMCACVCPQVRANKRMLQVMHRTHLQRFMPALGQLDAYREMMTLLENGVAYHHSGMLPVLRECALYVHIYI